MPGQATSQAKRACLGFLYLFRELTEKRNVKEGRGDKPCRELANARTARTRKGIKPGIYPAKHRASPGRNRQLCVGASRAG